MLKSKIHNQKSECQILKKKFCRLAFEHGNYFVICALSFVILVSGCASLKEGTKGILGISTKVLEDKRPEAEVSIVDYDYFTCYHKVLDTLKNAGSYVYAREDDLIAFYVSSTDTTPVGVFLKELDKQKTQLEVSSPSASAKQKMAQRIFSAFGEKQK